MQRMKAPIVMLGLMAVVGLLAALLFRDGPCPGTQPRQVRFRHAHTKAAPPWPRTMTPPMISGLGDSHVSQLETLS